MKFLKANSKAIASGIVTLLGVAGLNQFTEANVGLVEMLVTAVIGIAGVYFAPANS